MALSRSAASPDSAASGSGLPYRLMHEYNNGLCLLKVCYMNYYKYIPIDVVNGPGTRCTLFVCGCEHHCRGCYNQATWPFDAGFLVGEDQEDRIISDLNDRRIHRRGLSLSGGEPLHPRNVPALLHLVRRIREECSPQKDIWLWSGFVLDELNAEQTEELTGLVRKGRGQVNLPGGLHAVKGKQAIHLTGIPGNRFQPEPFPEKTTVYGNIRLEITGSAGNPGNGKTEQEPDDHRSGGRQQQRTVRIQPRPDYLADRGIDLPWREEIPLICRDNEVLIAAGVGTGRIPAWNEACKNIRIRWSGEMPWAL